MTKLTVLVLLAVIYHITCAPTYANITIGEDYVFPSESEVFYGVVILPANTVMTFLVTPFKGDRKVYAKLGSAATLQDYDWDMSGVLSGATGLQPTLSERTIHFTVFESVGHGTLKIETSGKTKTPTVVALNQPYLIESDVEAFFYAYVPAGSFFSFNTKKSTTGGYAGFNETYDTNGRTKTSTSPLVVIDNSKRGGTFYFSALKYKGCQMTFSTRQPVITIPNEDAKNLIANNKDEYYFTLSTTARKSVSVLFESFVQFNLSCTYNSYAFKVSNYNPAALVYVPLLDEPANWYCSIILADTYYDAAIIMPKGTSLPVDLKTMNTGEDLTLSVSSKSTNTHYIAVKVPEGEKLYIKSLSNDVYRNGGTQSITAAERGSLQSALKEKEFVGRGGVWYDFVVTTSVRTSDTQYTFKTSNKPIVDDGGDWTTLYIICGVVGGIALLLILAVITIVVVMVCINKKRKESYGPITAQPQQYYQ